MALRKPIFISEQGYSQELDGYADSVQLSAIQIIDADGNQKLALDGYNGNISVAGAADLNGSLDVAGQVDLAASGVATSVRGTLDVAESAFFDGYFVRVSGNLDGYGNLAIAGSTDLNGSLDVAGQVDLAASGVATSVRGTLSVAEETTLASAIVSDLTNTRVVFAGASGALVDSANLTFNGSTLSVGESAGAKLFTFGGGTNALQLRDTDDSTLTNLFSDGTIGGGLRLTKVVNMGSYNEYPTAIELLASTGTITIGDERVAGNVSIKDASDAEVIRLDGYAGNGTFAGSLDVGALALNANGDAFIQNLQMPAVGDGYDAVNRAYVDGYVSDLLLQINAASDSSFSDFTAAESLALGNPVFINTSSKAAKADADFESKSWVIGVAKAAASAEAAVEIIRDGVCAGALTGLSFAAADQIWLAPGGGLVNAKPTASGARLILVGFAKSADDLFVDIRDYGRNV